MARKEHAVRETLQMFMQNQFAERKELVTEIESEMLAHRRLFNHFCAEIGQQAMKNNLSPTGVLALGLMYGQVLGILMEKYKHGRIV